MAGRQSGLSTSAPGVRPARLIRLGLIGAALALAALAGCGRSNEGGVTRTQFDDTFIAAKINGRPIYQEDVRDFAVRSGRIREGEELSPDSDVYHLALEDLITERLFAREAEARGLDRDPEVRRRLDAARERILADAVYSEIEERVTDPDNIRRLYERNVREMGDVQEVLLRHIQFDTRESAAAAKRRLGEGERFEVLALQLSRDRETGTEGGELGWIAVDDLPDGIRQAVEGARVNEVTDPVRSDLGWHLLQVTDRRARGAPTLAQIRQQIIDHQRFEEVQRLRERLEGQVRIEIAAERPPGEAPDAGMEPPADSPAQPPSRTPSVPMGPGGVAAPSDGGEIAAPPPAAPAPPADEPEEPPPDVTPAPIEERET